MGIRGLAAYISNRSERFLETYALHDTYLVIDGNCIACQLYMYYTKSYCLFGGDYDKYALCVSEFFDELLKCNVTPLVIIDGGCEDKKLKTIISRTKEKLQRAACYTPASQNTNKFLPLMLKEVFKDVMNRKGIRYAQCIFEADNTIAAIARILNCPVLSYDSDFYIYGSLYIPFDTWSRNFVSRNPSGNGYVKYCKIYHVNKLFQFYKGLNQLLLPLAAMLLGNDYVKPHTFKNFFRHLKLPHTGRIMYSDQQRRIDATFNWLRRHNLPQAVTGILSRLQKQERKRVLNIIEMVLNSYSSASLSVLHMLGIPPEHCSKKAMEYTSKKYKFEGDIYNLTYVEENSSEANLSDDDEELDDQEITNILQGKNVSNESLVDTLPQWFIDEFKLSRYPSYFIDIIIRRLYVCPIQIEDFSCPTSLNASLNIISVIYALLISEVKGNKTCLEYITRENKEIKCYELEYNDTLYGCQLPLLSNLRTLPVITRREIMNATLGISHESYLHEIPSSWMLYIAIIKYWIDQQEEPCNLGCHVYSLLFAMLFTIIDCNIGVYRNPRKFHDSFDHQIDMIRYTRRRRYYNSQYSENAATLGDAFHEVNVDDCYIAASWFQFNFEMNTKLYAYPKTMNTAIIHRFAEFQNCLRHAMNLNALLDYPYEQTKVANVFNGTLLYNLCDNFKRRGDVEAYINLVLKESPSLLRLFDMLLSKVKPLFGTALEKKIKKFKKRKTKKYNENKCTEEENDEETTNESNENEETFYDANNSFSILNVVQH